LLENFKSKNFREQKQEMLKFLTKNFCVSDCWNKFAERLLRNHYNVRFYEKKFEEKIRKV